MQVLVVRHGIAMDREDAAARGVVESERPLTGKGIQRMKKAARGIAVLNRQLDHIDSSPYRRAVETAEIVARAYDDLEIAFTDSLLPEAPPDALCDELAKQEVGASIAVVGHEPHMSRWVSFCLSGGVRPLVALRKGGACLLQFEGHPGPALGQLVWLATPSSLRRISRTSRSGR